MKRQTTVFGEKGNITNQAADNRRDTSLVESDEIRQINSETRHEDELSQSLDDDDATGEENDELEEEEEVKAAARANQA